MTSFFQLGGDSITAVRLVFEIKTRFNVELDPAAVFRFPTVEQLSRTVSHHHTTPSDRSVIKVSRGPGHRRFFGVPGTLGNVFNDFGRLASYLEPECVLFGFQDGIRNPQRIERLSAKYIREMRGIDPDGPYFLMGVCSGAVIAFEMARQLIEAGKSVAFLGMVEPSPPRTGVAASYVEFIDFILRRALRHAARRPTSVARLAPEERKLYFKIRLRFYAVHLAVRRYRPKAYPNHLHLYLTDESLKDKRQRMARWASYSQQSPEVRRISGTHDSIVGNYGTPISEAGMRGLAAHLKSDSGIRSPEF